MPFEQSRRVDVRFALRRRDIVDYAEYKENSGLALASELIQP